MPEDSGFAGGDLVVGIVRRPDPVPCRYCAVHTSGLLRAAVGAPSQLQIMRSAPQPDNLAMQQNSREPDVGQGVTTQSAAGAVRSVSRARVRTIECRLAVGEHDDVQPVVEVGRKFSGGDELVPKDGGRGNHLNP